MHRVTIILSGNTEAVKRKVRDMLDRAGFTDTPFQVGKATEREIIDNAIAIADRRLDGG